MRDVAVCERVARDHGVIVELRQLRRWRYWKLIPRSPERVRGWRPGLADAIPVYEVRWVAEAARLFKRHRRKEVVALLLAKQGFPLGPDAVKVALLDYFDSDIATRELSNVLSYRQAARGKGSIARANATLVRDYGRLGVTPPEPGHDELPVHAHARHRGAVLRGVEPAKVASMRITPFTKVPTAITLDEARRAIVEISAADVCVALRMAGTVAASFPGVEQRPLSGEEERRGIAHAVDYLARGLVQFYRDALAPTAETFTDTADTGSSSRSRRPTSRIEGRDVGTHPQPTP